MRDVIAALARECVDIVGAKHVLLEPAALACYGYDAFLEEASPELVVIPRRREAVAPIVRAAIRYGVPYVARGSGTSYTGGVLALQGGLVISLAAVREIRQIDVERQWALVDPGVTTDEVAMAAAHYGLRYAPDPSSYRVCTIGGNVATNAGGPHSLRYGTTSNHVLEVELVDGRGRILTLGGETSLCRGLDLRGIIVGSEGTLGIVTGIRLRLLRQPQHARTMIAEYDCIAAAIEAIHRIVMHGAMPEALDMTASSLLPLGDGVVEADSTLLFADVEGSKGEVSDRMAVISELLRPRSCQVEQLTRSELMVRRSRIVSKRIAGMIAATGFRKYFLFDAVVPRSELESAMEAMRTGCRRHRLPMLNTFHAGDGNVHPTPFYDPGDPTSKARLMGFWREYLEFCLEHGGVLSGEHGIGLEKVSFLPRFTDPSALAVFRRLKQQLDPKELCNPGKLLSIGASDEREPVRRRSMHRRDCAVKVDVLNGYVDVAGHVLLRELRAALKNSPYEVPLEPIGEGDDWSVAQAVLSGYPTMREYQWGCARDVLLGGRLERNDGRQIEFGARVQKCVAGYDIRRLVTGSRGRIGRLVRACLRLSPRSEYAIDGVFTVPTSQAARLAKSLCALTIQWSYLGVLGRTAQESAVVFRVEGTRSVVEVAQERLRATLGPTAKEIQIRENAEVTIGQTMASAGDRCTRFVEASPWELKYLDADRPQHEYLSLAGIRITAWVGPPLAKSPPEVVDELEVAVQQAFTQGTRDPEGVCRHDKP